MRANAAQVSRPGSFARRKSGKPAHECCRCGHDRRVHAGPGARLIVLLLSSALAVLTIAIPVAGYFLAMHGAEAMSGSWKDWLVASNAIIMAVLLLVFGVLLFSSGMVVLAA